MPELIFFTKYSKKKFDIKVYSLFDDQYIDVLYSIAEKISPFYVFKRYLKRIFQLLTISRKDIIVVIEYELFPYFPPLFEYILKWRSIKFILDYDDAIFHNYDSSTNKLVKLFFSNKIANISKIANHIITGSPYLTNYFLKFNKNLTEIPTSLEFEKYININTIEVDNSFTIGWLGSNSTSKNLNSLIPVFQKISNKYRNVIFAFCGINNDVASNFIDFNFKIIEWSSSNELGFLNNIQVGIMPLELNKFNNGKCGFKLIQYMAMGKPTISTPLEANIKIDHQNGNLFANTQEEWYSCFENIIQHYDPFKIIGYKNRQIIKDEYSIELNYKKYFEIFKVLNS
jgi:glycosyltransferase involved in cell wall biosynthesis